MQFSANIATATHRPAVNILESAEGFRLELAVPGFSKEDISILINDGILTIRGEAPDRETAENVRYVRQEFGPRSFERSFRLTEKMDTDSVKASFEQGVLLLNIAKLVPAKKVIEVA